MASVSTMQQAAVGPSSLRILIYSINYAPEPTGVGKYTGEFCSWLAARGHSVRVVTTPPWFPDWSTPAPYRNSRYASEVLDGVRVNRAPIWLPQTPSFARRVTQMLSFALSSTPLMLAQIVWRPQVVVMTAPSLLGAPVAVLTAWLSGARSWLHVQDFEVDAAFGLGVTQGLRMQRMALAVERFLMRRFDRVSTISEPMRARLVSKGIRSSDVRSFANWADIDRIRPLGQPSAYREQLKLPPEAVVALYSGSMGTKQGLETLADAARLLQDEAQLHFVFCGGGVGREAMLARSEGLDRIHWLPLQPQERLGELLGVADIHLLPQRRGAADLVMPSKLTGMLASGRPIVVTADPSSGVARFVTGCGVVVPPEEPVALATAIRVLARDPVARAAYGARARALAVAEFSKQAILERFEVDLRECLT